MRLIVKKAINRIKYYLEHDIVLILKKFSTTYASLYDLLNQRFTYIENQKYAEISLGEITNFILVNNNLKIIILIREDTFKDQDPPFLNNIVDAQSKEIANKIIIDYKKLFKKPIKAIKYNFENELPYSIRNKDIDSLL